MTEAGRERLRRAAGPALGAGAKLQFDQAGRDALETALAVSIGQGSSTISSAHLWFAALRVPGPAREVQRAIEPTAVIGPDLPRGQAMRAMKATQHKQPVPSRYVACAADRTYAAARHTAWRAVYEPGLLEDPAVESVVVQDGPRGLGEVRRLRRRGRDGMHEALIRIVGFDVGRSLTFESWLGGAPQRITINLHDEQNRTVVRMNAQIRFDELLALVYESHSGDLGLKLGQRLQRDLDLLDQYLCHD